MNNAERSLIIAALVIMGLALAFFTLTWRGTQLGPELNSWPKLTAVLAFSYREDLAVYEARIRSQRGPYRGQESAQNLNRMEELKGEGSRVLFPAWSGDDSVTDYRAWGRWGLFTSYGFGGILVGALTPLSLFAGAAFLALGQKRRAPG